MPLELTPQNQLRRFYEDVERMEAGRKMDFSIGQHIELLIKRMGALEASAIEARRAVNAEGGAVACDESAVPNGQTPR